jgi:hypothetical protein
LLLCSRRHYRQIQQDFVRFAPCVNKIIQTFLSFGGNRAPVARYLRRRLAQQFCRYYNVVLLASILFKCAIFCSEHFEFYQYIISAGGATSSMSKMSAKDNFLDMWAKQKRRNSCCQLRSLMSYVTPNLIKPETLAASPRINKIVKKKVQQKKFKKKCAAGLCLHTNRVPSPSIGSLATRRCVAVARPRSITADPNRHTNKIMNPDAKLTPYEFSLRRRKDGKGEQKWHFVE